MPRVPLKKLKNKINYTVSVRHNQICTVSAPLNMPHQHFVRSNDLESKTKES